MYPQRPGQVPVPRGFPGPGPGHGGFGPTFAPGPNPPNPNFGRPGFGPCQVPGPGAGPAPRPFAGYGPPLPGFSQGLQGPRGPPGPQGQGPCNAAASPFGLRPAVPSHWGFETQSGKDPLISRQAEASETPATNGTDDGDDSADVQEHSQDDHHDLWLVKKIESNPWRFLALNTVEEWTFYFSIISVGTRLSSYM